MDKDKIIKKDLPLTEGQTRGNIKPQTNIDKANIQAPPAPKPKKD